MERSKKRRVRQRAGNRCEYCRLHQDQSPLAALQIEHINPKKHGGTDNEDNLALACIDCNLGKSSNLAGRDPLTKKLTRLFNPRTDQWDKHFEVQGSLIVGKTSVGRTTVAVLNMNSRGQRDLRTG